MSGTNARVVIRDPAGHHVDPEVLATVSQNLGRMPGVAVVDPPVPSSSGATAWIDVQYNVPVTSFSGNAGADALTAATAPAKADGLQVALGGEVPENVMTVNGAARRDRRGGRAHLVLLLALRSLAAAGLPLLVEIAGLGAGTAVIGLLCALTDISPTAPHSGGNARLGVGIDYALLLVARHVEGLRSGLSPREAAARAPAGTSVVIARPHRPGVPFRPRAVHAADLRLVQLRDLRHGHLRDARRAHAGARPVRAGRPPHPAAPRPARPAGASGHYPRQQRWAAWVTRRPLAAALAATGILVALAAPALGMRTWPDDAGTMPISSTARQAYDLVTADSARARTARCW